jgi:acetyl-CoA carboxylase biotin carboxyl carrier protein
MSLSFDPKTLAELASLLTQADLSEIELAEGDRKVRLVRTITHITVPVAAAPMAAPVAASPAAAPAAADPAKHPGAVKCPMVGVAYLSAEPGSPPYISVGQTIEAGATLLLVEAMKTFNQIKAPKSGVVKSILISSGQPVEYDEPLVIIE